MSKELIKETNMVCRDSWYAKGDYICSIIDEGRENEKRIREAQIKALKSEFNNLAFLYTPDPPSHHDGEPGPYFWEVKMYSKSDVERFKDNNEYEVAGDETVIGHAGGYDSTGFGYHFILRDDGLLYDSENGPDSEIKEIKFQDNR